MSKMTIKDQANELERSQQMFYVEFLELICRIAYLAEIQLLENDERPDLIAGVKTDQ